MVNFEAWCETAEEVVSGHNLKVLSMPDGNFNNASELVAAAVPAHFASEEQMSRILERLGKPKAAAYLREKLPQNTNIRSGDLGEILATQYIDECTEFNAPIRRLRWKDHREMAMRGDDVIAITFPTGNAEIQFLKSEVKSRVALATSVVEEAREALDSCGGLPSPHALSFVSDRLHETGHHELADLIDLAQLQDGITKEQVHHLLFVFCGNAPTAFLKVNLEGYAGTIPQNAVGLRVVRHQQFIAAVFETVETNHES